MLKYPFMRPLLSLCCSLFISNSAIAHESPITLIDLPVNEARELQLTTGLDYLLVINNEFLQGMNFHFAEFGQNIFTHYLQGAVNVSQDSLMIGPSSKVFWHFSPTKAGEFTYYSVNSSTNQPNVPGKIIIKQNQFLQQAESKVEENIPASEEKVELPRRRRYR